MDPISLPPLANRAARLLVAMSDDAARTHVVEALEGAGHVVIDAPEAADLVERVRAARPDLVLLETTLEGGAGIEALGDLRMCDPQRLVPVVLWSPDTADEEDVVHGLLAGADDHLVGLNRMRETLARIEVQLRNRRDRDMLRSAQKERVRLLDDVLTDPLTGVGNRRAADLALSRALDGAETVLLMVVDVDHFKRVNDTYGHAAGDDVLRALGRCLARTGRDGDTIARFGGEEFLVVIRDAPERSHATIAERFLLGIRAMRIQGAGPPRITASIGAASWSRDAWRERALAAGNPCESAIGPPAGWDGETGGRALFELADRALYRAKRGGRDALIVAHAAVPDQDASPEGALGPPRENAA